MERREAVVRNQWFESAQVRWTLIWRSSKRNRWETNSFAIAKLTRCRHNSVTKRDVIFGLGGLVASGALAVSGCSAVSLSRHHPAASRSRITTAVSIANNAPVRRLVYNHLFIKVPKTWLVIHPSTLRGLCTDPRRPGTVWVGPIVRGDCAGSKTPGGAPSGSTIVVFGPGYPPTANEIVGTRTVGGLRVDVVRWHLGALLYQSWQPGKTIGYYVPKYRVTLAAQGPTAQAIVDSFGRVQ